MNCPKHGCVITETVTDDVFCGVCRAAEIAAAGDLLAHQLQYSQCPEILERWWKVRGGRGACTVCAPSP